MNCLNPAISGLTLAFPPLTLKLNRYRRVFGFDNERGKGDHCHLDGIEMPYTFISVEKLVGDFIAAVAARREL